MKSKALIAAVLCAGLARAGSDEFGQHLQQAAAEETQGNLGAAIGDLQAALALRPDSAVAWFHFGLLSGQMADFRSAEAAFRRALQLNPALAEAHYNLALTLIANPQSKLDWPAAIAECRAAIELRPDYAEAMNLLGTGLSTTGDSQAAMAEFRRALQLKPKFAEAHFNLGMALDDADDAKDAEKEYRLALEARPGYPEVSTALGKLLSRTNRNAEAETNLTAALVANPDLADAHYALARVLQSGGRTAEAKVEFAAAHELTQRKPNAMQSSRLSNQALETAQHADLTGAIGLLRQAVELKPDYGIPHCNLGLMLADTGDFASAAQELSKAISLLPGDPKPWFELGRVLHRQGHDSAAAAAFEWAARLSPAEPRIRRQLDLLQVPREKLEPTTPPPGFGPAANTAVEHTAFALRLTATGDVIGAVGELLRALALQPANVEARYQLAIAYAQLKQTDLTTIELHNVLRISPHHLPAHLLLGETLLKAGDSAGASDQFHQVLRLKPDCAEALTALQRTTHQ